MAKTAERLAYEAKLRELKAKYDAMTPEEEAAAHAERIQQIKETEWNESWEQCSDRVVLQDFVEQQESYFAILENVSMWEAVGFMLWALAWLAVSLSFYISLFLVFFGSRGPNGMGGRIDYIIPLVLGYGILGWFAQIGMVKSYLSYGIYLVSGDPASFCSTMDVITGFTAIGGVIDLWEWYKSF